MGDLYRFKRRLLSRGRGARAYQVPTLCLQRQSLRVPGAPLRSVDGSRSLHKDREGHRGLPQSTRCRYAPVLGRLADEKSVKIPGGVSPRFDAILGEQAGVPCERGQIPAHPHSGPGLPGFNPGSPEYAHIPERKEDSQGYPPRHLSSLRELVPMAVVHTRPIQLMLNDQWTQVSDNPYVRIFVLTTPEGSQPLGRPP